MTAKRACMLIRPERPDVRDTALMAAWPPPDPLGEALHLLRMDGGFYSPCRADRARGA